MSVTVATAPPESPVDIASLVAGYGAAPGTYDELIAPDNSIRPQWRRVLGAFGAMSAADRTQARETARRLLQENGVTYVAQEDVERRSRPWQLDLFPLIISQAEWRALEVGLIQRARLLNAILGDLYGPQRLLKEGALPPALVFGNPEFLRACHGLAVPNDVHLHFLAFDLGRLEGGQWVILGDRTHAPSGAGYALENRIVASRCLPDLFGLDNVQRLAGFFRAFSENFLQLARRDEPLAVVLSPGPTKANYFEHAYLARYLGYPVVEGFDLTVRDDRLYLKTVEGLKPVDLVLRRLESELCDPLELRTDSFYGVPGLVQAAREGQVAIANALGSGLVENEALVSFMPDLCRFLLGEDLRIPGIPTWWCGRLAARNHVLASLERMVVRKAFTPRSITGPAQDTFVGPLLAQADREKLALHIMRQGYAYIGQDVVSLSTTPVWRDGNGLRPGAMTIRVYLAATADGYRVMPGGMARVATSTDARGHWHEPTDLSKDTWVLSDGPVEHRSMFTQGHHAVRLRRGGRDLPSRSADNLFWFGRYAERCEGAVRLMRSLVTRLAGEATPSARPVTLDRLVSLLVMQEHLSQRRAKRAIDGGIRAVESEMWTILFDPEISDGLARILSNVRRTAELVRELLSADTWQIIKEMSEVSDTWKLTPGQEVGDALHLLNRLIQHLAALNGMVMENMTRGYGWRFLDMGRRLERVRHATKLARDLTVRGDPESDGALDLLLELADSSMTYRTRYRAAPVLAAVLDLLLADESNPRSTMFQLGAIEDHLSTLHQAQGEEVLSPAQRAIIGLRADVRLADMMQLSDPGAKGSARVNLERLLRRTEKGCFDLSDLIGSTYFSHSTLQRVFGPHWTEAAEAAA